MEREGKGGGDGGEEGGTEVWRGMERWRMEEELMRDGGEEEGGEEESRGK
jgi:hypothetical protein